MSGSSDESSVLVHTRIISPSLSLPAIPSSSASRYDLPLSHFNSNAWTRGLLTSSPNTHIFLPQCRNPITDLQDQFFANLLGSPGGLEHMLSYFSVPEGQDINDPKVPVERISTLYTLGEKVTGVAGILHGGVTMSLVDEAMSQIIELNSALKKDGPTWTNTGVTATLEIKFLKGIPANSTIVAHAWLESTERRKSRILCEMFDEDGQKLASVKSVWVSLLSNL
ncbi:thioesterase superfamily protein [Sarocladium implicatum]|nr:thioesterase superfamily protein [Sarocladium implicatum]